MLFFLVKVFIISFSGAMQPGPVTATAIIMGERSKYAGALMAIGHGIIELPLMVMIVLGADALLKSNFTQMLIGLTGGVFLMLMSTQMLISLKTPDDQQSKYEKSRPVIAGLLLSASNPYFLLWWATIGLALATNAKQLGIWAFVLFAIVHWACDLVWFQALSWASFKGTKLLKRKISNKILLACSIALSGYGLFFIYSAIVKAIALLS